ncbi:MAG: DUF4417 domain-containing protein [Candidatus Borkfalkiaceae bacterium]|nr:DUF4417 domain-containing protein [Christensenellaceae bacterium]
MKDDCKYEKADQKIIRNEFLHNGLCCGKYDFPIIRKQAIDVDEISLISYCDIKKGEKGNAGKTVHFFTYDWKFEKVYENAEEELQKLSEFYCVLSPDFSLFTNMPRALQIESVFKNRWCGAFWQSKGLKVIPTVSWSDEKSFDFCFEGMPDKNNTNLAKTPLFTRFFANSRTVYIQYYRPRLCNKSSKISAFLLLASLTACF